MKRLRAAATSLTLIVAIAFVARVGFAVSQARKIPDVALAHVPFENETGSIAQAIATGQGFSNPFARKTGPTAWLTPIYPWLVVVAFKIFGVFTIRAFYFLVFLNVVFSSAACVPMFVVGRRVAGVGVGAGAAWLWAVYPNAVMTPFEWIWDTSFAALLSVVLLWATTRLAQSRRMRDWCLYGLLWGLVLMTNPSLGSLLPFLLGWAAYRAWWKPAVRSTDKAWLLQPSAALAIAMLCCVPWTIRNYAAFHRFVPLRSNFPLELYIGNNENYDDQHPHYPGMVTKDRETWRYIKMGETSFMDEEMRKAKKFIYSHPRVEAILFGERFIAFWGGVPNPIDKFMATDSWLARSLILCAIISGVGALAGIVVLLWHRSDYAIPLAVYPLVFPFLYYITHTSLRYRHPIDPEILLLTAIAGGALTGLAPTGKVGGAFMKDLPVLTPGGASPALQRPEEKRLG
ncbi:MAG TPA: glycosyltransferase family 39 protein [Candidatus Sulfotelmatobacter sp.]|nr:glycosyltransferase family 39 protein [Candidatus Sulfotelmatobacter sp.]